MQAVMAAHLELHLLSGWGRLATHMYKEVD